MGHTTSYLGRLDITPPVNPVETEWLRAIRVTERAFHPDDPYAVPARTPAASFPADRRQVATKGATFVRGSVAIAAPSPRVRRTRSDRLGAIRWRDGRRRC